MTPHQRRVLERLLTAARRFRAVAGVQPRIGLLVSEAAVMWSKESASGPVNYWHEDGEMLRHEPRRNC